MRLSFLLFMIGFSLIVMGYTNQISPTCNQGPVIKYVPRTVYDDILLDSSLGPSNASGTLARPG